MRPTRQLVVILAFCLAMGCAAPPKPGPATLRLTDLYKPESVANRVPP